MQDFKSIGGGMIIIPLVRLPRPARLYGFPER